MNAQAWKIFSDFTKEYKAQIEKWMTQAQNLPALQKAAADYYKTPEYPMETAIVYNTALDEITPEDDIKLIVIGDNPGKDEQLKINNKYLVGQAGKIANGYFKRNPELGVDFRKNVIILNKTPIHSAKTNQLKKIAKDGGKEIADLIEETQIWMARKTAELHQKLCKANKEAGEKLPEIWLVGYSELKSKGIFGKYRDELKASYNNENQEFWNAVYTFQHFSMNCFIQDLGKFKTKPEAANLSLEESLHQLGTIRKNEIFN